jgi:fimbrial isopeptide formation D2 family protein/LPXTG-motif cell wall-anchored protein
MIVAMAVNVGATSANTTGEVYTAYQIFSGTQAADDYALGEIKWGSGVKSTELLAALKADTAFGEGEANIFYSASTADEVAKVLKDYESKSDVANEFARVAFKNKKGTGQTVISNETTLTSGYYLVVDTTTYGDTDTNRARNMAILRITRNEVFHIESKTSVPTVENKVKEKNDSTGTESDWTDDADYDVNDEVPFQLTATLPNHYADYTKYKLIFNDTLSAGLDYIEVTKVYIQNGELTVDMDTTECTVAQDSSNAHKLTFTFEDLKKTKEASSITADSKIVVEYKAKLNSDANIGSEGNPNTVYLQYSNNPNYTGTDDTTTPDDDDTLGKTPEDTVIVFTYQLQVAKVDDGENPLAGAEFTLYKYDPKSTAADKDGYILIGKPDPTVDVEETTTEEVEEDTDDSEIKEDNNESGKTAATAVKNLFTFKGLDAGQYKLVESKTPNGYDGIDDIIFTIASTITNSKLTNLNAKRVESNTSEASLENDNTAAASVQKSEFTVVVSTGTVRTEIENLKGGVLPTTGGMGTTLFTVCGIVLMLGASILLVTRKRMSK